RAGRKAVLVSYLVGTMVSGYLFGAATSVNELLLWGALLSFFNLGAWGALYAYTPEHYPAHIRATGAGFAAAIGRIGGIFGPLLVGYLIAMQFSITTIFSLFCIALLLAIVTLMLWGQETKMKVLD
ncbi:MAG: MFS transporter, partial [Enterobacteriaceae bacterium]